MKRLKETGNLAPRVILCCILMSLFHHSVGASNSQIFSGPVSQGMGGGGRAGAEVTDLLFLNPALAALGTGFDVGFVFRDGYWADGHHENSIAITMVENDPGNITPGGFSFIQKQRTAPNYSWRERYFYGALGKSISQHFSIGLSAYYLELDVKEAPDHKIWNGAVGTLITVTPQLGFAYVYTNVATVDKDVPVVMRPVPQQSLAANYVIADLIRLTADVTRWERQNPDNKGIIQLGLEVRATEYGAIRLGYSVDDIQKTNAASFGLGFQGPRLRANYAFTKPIKDSDGAMHSVDLRMPF